MMELLDNYVRLCFIHNPQVLSILALTYMHQEGKALGDTMANLASTSKLIKAHITRITRLNNDHKNLRDNNPSLK